MLEKLKDSYTMVEERQRHAPQLVATPQESA